MTKKKFYPSTKFGMSTRRAAKYGIVCEITLSEWVEILDRSAGYCAYCHQFVGEEFLTIDHVIPLVKGGRHHKDNILPACVYCNLQKGDDDTGGQLRSYPFIDREAYHIEMEDIADEFGIYYTGIQHYVKIGVTNPVGIWRKNFKTPLFTRDSIDHIRAYRATHGSGRHKSISDRPKVTLTVTIPLEYHTYLKSRGDMASQIRAMIKQAMDSE